MSAPSSVEAAMIRAGGARLRGPGRVAEAAAAFARALGPALRTCCEGEVGVRLHEVRRRPLAEASPAEGCVCAEAACGPGAIRLRADLAALHALIALWSRDGGAPREARPLTPVERRLALRLCDLTFETFAEGFAPPGALDPAPAVLVGAHGDDPPEGEGTFVDLALHVGGRAHALALVIPDVLGAPARRAPEAPGPTPDLTRRIGAAQVTLAAVLHGRPVRLGEALGWAPGTVVDLGLDRTHPVALCRDGRTLFHGVAGRRRGGRMALRLVQRTDRKEETT